MDFLSNHPTAAGETNIAAMAEVRTASTERLRIGEVMDISGSSSQVMLNAESLHMLAEHTDSAISMAGQVGSQIKIR
ncbi:MAG: ATPase, partial [Sphingopyxis sp.]